MTSRGQSRFVQRMARAAQGVAALTGLLEQVAALLHQLVIVAGWVVLLCGSVVLVFQSHPPLEHLVAPGAGALAVIQGRIAAWLSRRTQAAGAQEVPQPESEPNPAHASSTLLDVPSAGNACDIPASDTMPAALGVES